MTFESFSKAAPELFGIENKFFTQMFYKYLVDYKSINAAVNYQ